MKAAIYARVSTLDQTAENQLLELRRYVAARGWAAVEYVDHGISGTKESRPALDGVMTAVRQRHVDVVVVFALDRVGRSLGHLVRIVEEWQSVGVSLISLRDGLDLGSASGRLQMHILAALAEFERGRLRERTLAGLQRAKAQGKRIGRPWKAVPTIAVPGGTVRGAAAAWGVSKSTAARWIASGRSPAIRGTTAPPRIGTFAADRA